MSTTINADGSVVLSLTAEQFATIGSALNDAYYYRVGEAGIDEADDETDKFFATVYDNLADTLDAPMLTTPTDLY